jgi:hypothetical protein
MVSDASSARLLIPARRASSREELQATEPFFLPDPPPLSTEAPPRLLSFESDRFMDDFLAVAGQTQPLPPLLPWRDWSETPAAMFDALGAPLYPASIARRSPKAAELATETGALIDDDGVPMSAPKTIPPPANPRHKALAPWLRKLYLPVHERFNIVAFDVVCRSAGWPRLARGRVKEAGAVIRRLRVDGVSAGVAAEAWDDWLAVDDKHGAWLPLLDGAMRPSAGAAAVDPKALPTDLLPDEASLRAVLDVPVGTPLPPLALSSQPLALLPPNVGAAAAHCTVFGYLPVFSAAQEVPRERLARRPLGEIAAALQARTQQQLGALFQTADGLSVSAAAPLRRLLDNTVLPTRPDAGELSTARSILASPGVSGIPAPAALWDALAQGIDLVLRRALWLLWNRVAAPATTVADLDGNVADGDAFWLASGATTAATTVDLFAGVPGAQTAAWLRQNAIQNTTQWDRLARARLHQAVDAWLAGDAMPPPAQGQSSVLGARELRALCAAALLRLRGCRLALAASINRALHDNDDRRAELTAVDAAGLPFAGLGSLAEQVEPFLVQEAGRDDPRTAPPWPTLTFPGLPDVARVRRVHRAGLELAALHAPFAVELAAAGSAATAELALRAGAVETDLRAAFQPFGSLPAFAPLGLALGEDPARGLLVLPGFHTAASTLTAFGSATAARYVARPEALALPEARARETVPRLRFDADHLYAVWCWVRVAGHSRCEPDRLLWTRRGEPFSIADPTDLLGARPASLQMPDIAKLLRDLPRIARARARPFAAVSAPPGSGISVGADMTDTRRDFGLGSICSFGIPALTICALILFNIIFHILLVLPGFGWMLLLKFCIPFRRRGS